MRTRGGAPNNLLKCFIDNKKLKKLSAKLSTQIVSLVNRNYIIDCYVRMRTEI